ncbi:MAG: hypothetical protein RQ862_02635 [Candidatus Caldarchaeales archaeon]|nr:hypothetical protein [Candidatus Caldarchaeales archaeon]
MSRVFVDFGRNRVYALPEDGGEVVVFGDFLEMFGKLRPRVVVADSYLRRLLPTMTRLDGAVSLRLGDLKAVSEVRRNNGLRKTDENDVKALRQMFYEAPDLFQPLYASSLELEVRALAELWVEMAGIKKMVKHTRTVTASPLAAEAHKVLQRYADRLGRGLLHLPSSPLGLSNVWLEKPNPPPSFPYS